MTEERKHTRLLAAIDQGTVHTGQDRWEVAAGSLAATGTLQLYPAAAGKTQERWERADSRKKPKDQRDDSAD